VKNETHEIVEQLFFDRHPKLRNMPAGKIINGTFYLAFAIFANLQYLQYLQYLHICACLIFDK